MFVCVCVCVSCISIVQTLSFLSRGVPVLQHVYLGELLISLVLLLPLPQKSVWIRGAYSGLCVGNIKVLLKYSHIDFPMNSSKTVTLTVVFREVTSRHIRKERSQPVLCFLFAKFYSFFPLRLPAVLHHHFCKNHAETVDDEHQKSQRPSEPECVL